MVKKTGATALFIAGQKASIASYEGNWSLKAQKI